MCEPSHSIVQWPDPSKDDDDNSASPQGGAEVQHRSVISRIGRWCKKVRDFWHISKMGAGHSRSIGTEGYGLTPTSYEAQWWDRTLHFDGGLNVLGKVYGRRKPMIVP